MTMEVVKNMDLVIQNGLVIDPETHLQQKMSIGIKDGRIVQLSKEKLQGNQVIEATGLIVAPGFIDLHAHEDSLSPTEGEKTLPLETAKALLHTGVTTMVGGNCGISAFSIKKQLEVVEQDQPPLNYYTLVGYITLRYLLNIGIYEQASEEQISQLKLMVDEALSQGALGVSFGLQYAPGIATREVIAISEIVKKHDKFIAVHMRYDYPQRALEAVQEMVKVAEITGVKIQISHLAANVYGGDNLKQALAIMEKCYQQGMDIKADMYPYDAWATSIKSAVFDEGVDNFNFTWEDIEILTGLYAEQRCTAELFGQLRKQKEDTSVVCHQAIPSEDLELALSHSLVCLGSDGQIRKDRSGNLQGHPRSAGSPARLIGKYVRGKKLLSLAEAISKLTLKPAERLNLPNKGRIQQGKDADITIFDFTEIREQSRYGDNVCVLPARGIAYVLVGGKVAYKNGNK